MISALNTISLNPPRAFNQRSADVAFERLTDADPDDALSRHIKDPNVRSFLDGVFSGSPFLLRVGLNRRETFAATINTDAGEAFDAICSRLKTEIAACTNTDEAIPLLRNARSDAALVIGLADLAGHFDVVAVTQRLTDFADLCVDLALQIALRDAHERGDLVATEDNGDDLSRGLIILGMGKYGASELNYSSDIDLIVLYDVDKTCCAPDKDPSGVFVRITKHLVKLLQDVTAEGFVFRVDLRLRPDGSASPVALSSLAALSYYESAGQNWERAAMIKARAVAGDIAAGKAFLADLVPFVWRKHLDYQAIADIHSIKRQIHSHKGHGQIAVAGHNLKLGRGGIREIEFFAQTQQLIVGGRDADLRVRRTDETLRLLASKGMIAGAARDELLACYAYLRGVEHRLQMVDDQQTHTLPKEGEALETVAALCGFDSVRSFTDTTNQVLECVQSHYAQLFETEESLASEAGSLVFTGVEDDPETLETIASLGFKDAKLVSSALRTWHRGRLNATRTARSRQLLTKLAPRLIEALGATQDPDQTFREFSRFVEGLPSGVQIFSLLASNTWLLNELADLFSLAPNMASVLSQAPGTLDSLLDTDFRTSNPSVDELKTDLDCGFQRFAHLETKLDVARIFARENRLRIATQFLSSKIDAETAGVSYSATAEAAVFGLYNLACNEIAERHGVVDGGQWAVLAMGKLGGRELTATSDLDLIFVYDHDSAAEQSDGEHPLAPSQYFARAGQRLINLLTAPTSEGVLYEVDMRLRPSGRAGPIAVSLERFRSYHLHQAWTWEQMALTRARIVAGPEDFGEKIEDTIREQLTRTRDTAALRTDVLDMRDRLAQAKKTEDPWQLKHVRGGLIDLEFIAQTLQLAHAARLPSVLAVNTADAFSRLEAQGILAASDSGVLLDTLKLVHGLSHLLRIGLGAEIAPISAPQALVSRLLRLSGAADLVDLEHDLVRHQKTVFQLFEKYISEIGSIDQRLYPVG